MVESVGNKIGETTVTMIFFTKISNNINDRKQQQQKQQQQHQQRQRQHQHKTIINSSNNINNKEKRATKTISASPQTTTTTTATITITYRKKKNTVKTATVPERRTTKYTEFNYNASNNSHNINNGWLVMPITYPNWIRYGNGHLVIRYSLVASSSPK